MRLKATYKRHDISKPVDSTCFFFETVKKSISDKSDNVTKAETQSIPILIMINSEIVLIEFYLEFYQALKVIQINLSLNSCDDLNPFLTNVLLTDKPRGLFLLAKCMKNTYGTVH